MPFCISPCPLQAKKAEHTHAILYPDHTFIDWQEADTTSWPRQQYIMHRSVSTLNPAVLLQVQRFTYRWSVYLHAKQGLCGVHVGNHMQRDHQYPCDSRPSSFQVLFMHHAPALTHLALLHRAAVHHPWLDRDSNLLFRGSNLTGQQDE